MNFSDASLIQINPQIMLANLSNSVSLDCNYTSTNQVIWIKTLEEENLFYVNFSDRVFLTNNRTTLNILNLTLADEEYYGCGFVSSTGEFLLMNAFYVYIKISPRIEFITELKNVSTRYLNASSFRITCMAINSKPDTFLAINDANSMFPVTTRVTNSDTKYCNELDLCTIMHQVEVLFDSLPNVPNSRDYTCSALSTTPNVDNLGTKTETINFNNSQYECNY
jgi:hypothetical protein